MELSVLERVLLLNSLPSEGDLTTIRLIREFREELSFSEEEHALLNFVQDGQQLKWDGKGISKDIEITAPVVKLVRATLMQLEKQEKLNVGHISLYEKFVGEE